MTEKSWPKRRVIVVIHERTVGCRRPMADNQQRSWTADEIVEDELPRPGVDNVIGKSYGCACVRCGHDVEYVCRQCGHEGTA